MLAQESGSRYDKDPKFLQMTEEEQRIVLKYDADKNGVISFHELMSLLDEFKKTQATNVALKKYIWLLVGIVVVMTASNLLTAIAAAYMAKEIKIGSDGKLTAMDGSAISSVGTSASIFTMAAVGANEVERKSRRLEDGTNSTLIGCVSVEQMNQMYGNAALGSSTMLSQTNSEGSEIRYQLVADGASLSSNTDTIQMNTASGMTIMFDRDDTCGSDNDQQNTRNMRTKARNMQTRKYKTKVPKMGLAKVRKVIKQVPNPIQEIFDDDDEDDV